MVVKIPVIPIGGIVGISDMPKMKGIGWGE